MLPGRFARRFHASARCAADLGRFRVPEIENEPMRPFPPGSSDRANLRAAIAELKSQLPVTVPCVVDGLKLHTNIVQHQRMPHDRGTVLAEYHAGDARTVQAAIRGAVHARKWWGSVPFADRAAIFLKAADLIREKYRWKLMAATMLGQGKNVWQAEIDAASELPDFFRFNVRFAEELYAQQPPKNADGTWNRMEWRPLEGFVAAVSPFNFTAIGGNLPGAPALMGNVVVWKPSDSAILSNYIVMQLLEEAGLPPGVVQFVPGPPDTIVGGMLEHPDFAGLHFTGSSAVFRDLYRRAAANLERYRSFPRIVGETGGKNMHFVHRSADPAQVVRQTVRAAFEYQGQKCSACSRLYVPDNLWGEVREGLVRETEALKMGSPEDFTNFTTPVINENAFKKITGYIEHARNAPDAKIIAGGQSDDSKGYFIRPTIIETTNPQFKTMVEEIFGPVLTVIVYPEDEYEKWLEIADRTTDYGLTAALFARDRRALMIGADALRNAAGNFYINDKCTGAIVGQQPFGGARQSGTNDKAGAPLNLYRWVSARTVKESFRGIDGLLYPSNLAD
ncbi:delta-1-pyrroline-5-carboxylate dehydrogenase [Hyaloraphidium curvatum]|nr:delta-1-pyrroline-5-carboxylate dehydrogenase [Hyaloraphidium curvatum]